MKKGIEEGKVRKIEGEKARMKGRMVWKGEKEERRNGNGIYTLTRWVGGLKTKKMRLVALIIFSIEWRQMELILRGKQPKY